MSKKEVTINAKIPLISDEEYNILNVEFHSIIGKIMKQRIKDKDLACAQYLIQRQEQENTNLKQALIDIREYIAKDIQECTYRQVSKYQEILQIIDKALGDDK